MHYKKNHCDGILLWCYDSFGNKILFPYFESKNFITTKHLFNARKLIGIKIWTKKIDGKVTFGNVA